MNKKFKALNKTVYCLNIHTEGWGGQGGGGRGGRQRRDTVVSSVLPTKK
jgi:hypothetical protein